MPLTPLPSPSLWFRRQCVCCVRAHALFLCSCLPACVSDASDVDSMISRDDFWTSLEANNTATIHGTSKSTNANATTNAGGLPHATTRNISRRSGGTPDSNSARTQTPEPPPRPSLSFIDTPSTGGGVVQKHNTHHTHHAHHHDLEMGLYDNMADGDDFHSLYETPLSRV